MKKQKTSKKTERAKKAAVTKPTGPRRKRPKKKTLKGGPHGRRVTMELKSWRYLQREGTCEDLETQIRNVKLRGYKATPEEIAMSLFRLQIHNIVRDRNN